MKKSILSFLRNNRFKSVNVDESVPLSYLSVLVFSAFVGFVRGYIKTRKLVIVGSRSRVSCVSMFHVGKGVQIRNDCNVDCWGKRGIRLGNRVSIGSHCLIKVSGSLATPGEGIRIGSNVGIGDFAHIGGSGGVEIGSDTISGAYLSIHPENHVFVDLDKPIRLQGVKRDGVVIGENCWIGAKVTFLDGSRIGNGCVVAAGSVVRGVYGNNKVLAGVPAKVIRDRCHG